MRIVLLTMTSLIVTSAMGEAARLVARIAKTALRQMTSLNANFSKVVGPPSEMLALLTTTAPAFVVSPRPTAPTLSTVAEVRTAAPQMFLG